MNNSKKADFKARIYDSNENTLKGRDISCNIINDDMTKPPKWFQIWSETVYQKQPPEWFRVWSETIYQNQPPEWFQKFEISNNGRFETLIKLNNLKIE